MQLSAATGRTLDGSVGGRREAIWEADDDYVVTIKPADCQRHIKKDTYEKGRRGMGHGATKKKGAVGRPNALGALMVRAELRTH